MRSEHFHDEQFLPHCYLSPGEMATFLGKNRLFDCICADWLFFKYPSCGLNEKRPANKRIYLLFKQAEYFLSINRELTDEEYLTAAHCLTNYYRGVWEKQKEHSKAAYGCTAIAILFALVIYLFARMNCDFFIDVPSKYEKWSYRQTNFFILLFLLIIPCFSLGQLIYYDAWGKQVLQDLKYMRSYFTETTQLSDIIQYRTFLPYAYAFGVEAEWAHKFHSEASQEFTDCMNVIYAVQAKIKHIYACEKKLRKH